MQDFRHAGLTHDFLPVAAGQTDFKLGNVGKSGDHLARLVLVPGTTTPGAVSIKDGPSGSSITLFFGGSVTDFRPIELFLDLHAQNAGWYITTGANITVLAIGFFS